PKGSCQCSILLRVIIKVKNTMGINKKKNINIAQAVPVCFCFRDQARIMYARNQPDKIERMEPVRNTQSVA
ncbi:MAG TPA: hypothetical protein DDZ44_07150, partial [Syntrophomonas wolfei]|nr:hypothetical protein [Syntrophomonas wolfei]